MEDVLATRTLAMASNCCSAPTPFLQSAMAHGHFRDIGKQIEILPTSVTSNQSHGEVLKTKACIWFFLVQFLSLEKVATIHRFAAPVRSWKAVEVLGTLGNRQTIVVLLWARRFPSNKLHAVSYVATDSSLGPSWLNKKMGCYSNTVACIRDVWPNEKIGLRLLPQWMEFQLLHGVEHFLIYTVNLDSKILVDLYEPYIKSGVATWVHFNKEVEGDSQHFHDFLQPSLLEDYLSRFKTHATWILPSIDIDEYINMTDGNLFEGSRMREDYCMWARVGMQLWKTVGCRPTEFTQ